MTESGVPSLPSSAAETFSLRNLINIFRRRVRLFGAVALLVFLAALLVTARATPRYTAQAQVMLNVRQSQVLDTQQVLSNLPAETGVVDSEVEVLQSRDLARQVAEVLRLENDPEFNWALRKPSGLGALIARVQGRSLAPPAPPTTPDEIRLGRERAASALRGGLKVQRMGLTYIIGVSFTSLNPEKSARIANAFAGQYIANQVSDKGGANRQANTFLEDRLNQLRGEVQSAEAAVESYRSANNLLTSSGATLTEQEVSTYNQQLATAQADQAVEEARLRAARSQLARGSSGGDVGEALQSSVVGSLRAQRATVAARVADLQARYGPDWPALVRARQELAAIDGQIQAEIQRVISNLEARVQVARDRTASLRSTLGQTRGALASNNAASVRLNELERNAESVRKLYEGLLERYQETTNQSGNETADSRMLQAARASGAPSSPNVPVNLVLGFILALGCGLAAVVIVELMDDGLITSEDVQRRLGLPMLGAVPLLMSTADRKDRRMAPTEYLLNRPLSAFAESFRTLRTSIMYAKLGAAAKVVVVTSALPGEGKTTTAVCLAISAAQAGLKVVIVDCDIRRRNVSRLLGVDADFGLLDVLDGSKPLAEVLLKGEASGAWVLPVAKRDFTPREVFNTAEMTALLSRLREDFDMVILDTAPVLAVAETRVLASQADAVMFLARWRKTPSKAAEAALRSLEQSEATVAGAVLTQVDVQEQARYGYGDPGYYYTAYKGYYTN
ncbi:MULTISPECIES: GumC family protein [Brevundimonas]|uniref:non-specific protein-tyrosine kinase n=1 Tax=Brevundimonas vesicularis TaxID=41276 RepID=A0ABU4KTN4_BREVE|nr:MULTISPECIES: polysaccharide biosynthesis tyrosine autokinase [Brevundimonas]MDX2336164.1 polysaccharide biosynthesis tyrosine autokinase [Brevundimonas vesicularis]